MPSRSVTAASASSSWAAGPSSFPSRPENCATTPVMPAARSWLSATSDTVVLDLRDGEQQRHQGDEREEHESEHQPAPLERRHLTILRLVLLWRAGSVEQVGLLADDPVEHRLEAEPPGELATRPGSG